MSLVSTLLASLGDGMWSGCTFDEAGCWSTALIVTLNSTLDSQSLVVGELELNILLVDAWDLAMKFVMIADLLEVELGDEGLPTGALVMRTVVLGVLGVVVEKSEERVEGGG